MYSEMRNKDTSLIKKVFDGEPAFYLYLEIAIQSAD